MCPPAPASTNRFCWLDLAATDADRAARFYGQMFGWEARDHAANGGRLTRLRHAGQDMGSLYQMRLAHIRGGVPSHWTPYVQVDNLPVAVRRAVACGGQLIVEPFEVAGMARIALIQDAVGALLGLWESRTADTKASAHGQTG